MMDITCDTKVRDLPDCVKVELSAHMNELIFKAIKKKDVSEFGSLEDMIIHNFTIDKSVHYASITFVLFGKTSILESYKEGDHRNVAPESEWRYEPYRSVHLFYTENFDEQSTIQNIIITMCNENINDDFTEEIEELTQDRRD
jgi:hypothetical protein